MGRQWQYIGPDKAKQHPLYGVSSWLAVFALGTMLAPFIAIGYANMEAEKLGMSLEKLLSLKAPAVTYLKVSLPVAVVPNLVILWLIFTKHPKFRVVTSSLILWSWPLVALVGAALSVPNLGAEFAQGFVRWLLACAIWITYLQRSKRVRVTFEHMVLVESGKIASPDVTGALSGATPANATGQERQHPLTANEVSASPLAARMGEAAATHVGGADQDRIYAQAAAEVESGEVDKGVWARLFAEADGDEDKTKARYIKYRAEKLIVVARKIDEVPPEAANVISSTNSEGDHGTTSSGRVPTLNFSEFLAPNALIFLIGLIVVLAYLSFGKKPEPIPPRQTDAAPVEAKQVLQSKFDLDDLIGSASAQYGIEPSLLKSLLHQESSFNVDAYNIENGKIGIAQLLPATAKELGIDPRDPIESVFGAANYLRKLIDQFDGDIAKGLAAYNWGQGNLSKALAKANGDDDWTKFLPAETADYLIKIANKREEYRLQFSTPTKLKAVDNTPRLPEPLSREATVLPSTAVLPASNSAPKDYTDVLKIIRPRATQGDAEAQVQLGDMYRYGQGVRQDYVCALMWTYLAAELENPNALTNREAIRARMTETEIKEAKIMQHVYVGANRRLNALKHLGRDKNCD